MICRAGLYSCRQIAAERPSPTRMLEFPGFPGGPATAFQLYASQKVAGKTADAVKAMYSSATARHSSLPRPGPAPHPTGVRRQ